MNGKNDSSDSNDLRRAPSLEGETRMRKLDSFTQGDRSIIKKRNTQNNFHRKIINHEETEEIFSKFLQTFNLFI